MEVVEEKGPANGKEDYTQDGTVDLKGRPVLRSKTGRWKACSFIVGYEVFERMAYYGIASNLVIYLTDKLHEGTVESANNVSNWKGLVWMMPLVGAYIADAYFGRYWTFVIASCIYLLGMCLLTLAVSVTSLRPPECAQGVADQNCPRASPLQRGIFFLALYIIAVGTGGTKPNISTMGADQFDEFEPKESTYKLSFFNWWYFSIFLGTLFSNTFVIYIQDRVGWAVGYGLPTIGLAVSVLVFLVGTPLYRHKLPSGSPMTRMLQVFVAAMRKWMTRVPENPRELHELSIEKYACNGRNRIDRSSSLRLGLIELYPFKFPHLFSCHRLGVDHLICMHHFFYACSFLDKAATKTGQTSQWMLCTVTQVEETKQMTKMIPILITTLIPSTLIVQSTTLFIKQGTTLDRRMGPHFDIPPACLTAFTTIFMLISIIVYDLAFVPMIRRYTKNPRGITLLQRLGIGLVLHIAIMVTACLAERKRLSVARENNLFGRHDTIPLCYTLILDLKILVQISFLNTDTCRFAVIFL
ncbi:putative proton-dependent oligopeptide transporter family, major facilitator superfamily [Medicago truncatula]|uniref:Putative proton-dependent oligopeptide transporter family, major facilitator superfamily n=1 Tax=Medicago truncatula TaxID=3880 RepID=A0A396H4Q1_MEDTR|nr:putative proton-dependent oligopeptide transporter family, major facilitator superfamily [Medicago truncatula]